MSCNCEHFIKPSYHANMNVHDWTYKFGCPVHGMQNRYFLIHKTKQEGCVSCTSVSQESDLETKNHEPWVSVEGAVFDAVGGRLQIKKAVLRIRKYLKPYLALPVSQESEVEVLAAQVHALYQIEAKRQGDVRHKDDYNELSENIKEFDRIIVRWHLAKLATERRAAYEEGYVARGAVESKTKQTMYEEGARTARREGLEEVKSIL